MSISRFAKSLRNYGIMVFGLGVLAFMCFVWGVVATVLGFVLPVDVGRRVGRRGAMRGFRAYLAIMEAAGALRLDLSALDSLQGSGPLIVAPNHPSLIDAVLVVSRLPDAFCVMKASLLGNFLLAPAARLARYVSNDSLLALAAKSSAELDLGGHLVLFPEGTRSTREPFGPFTAAVAVVSRRTGVPVQAVFIRADKSFLGKGVSLRECPAFPLRFRVELGRRFEPPKDVRAFTQELERHFATELAAGQAPAAAAASRETAGDRLPSGRAAPE